MGHSAPQNHVLGDSPFTGDLLNPLAKKGSPSGGCINRLDARSGSKAIMAEKRGVFVNSPDFSPDGRWIAFQAARSRREQLFVARVDGDLPVEPSRWIAITRLEYFDPGAHWSRDGKTVYSPRTATARIASGRSNWTSRRRSQSASRSRSGIFTRVRGNIPMPCGRCSRLVRTGSRSVSNRFGAICG